MLLLVVMLIFVGVTAREFTGQELSSFPRLFHLDDYEQCLARPGGLYCLGTFELTPENHPHPTYELMKEYSTDSRRHFNRTRIHRGYCVSERCRSATRNASLRFERCVDRFAQARSLRASLRQLEYCRSHAEAHAHVPTSPSQRTFLNVIYAILALNVVGTAYDVMTRNKPNKNKLLMAWSVSDNWRNLTSVKIGKDTRLNALLPLHGWRFFAISITSLIHTCCFHYLFYVKNPDYLENVIFFRGDIIFLSDGTSTVQTFIVLTSFLTGYNLLLLSENHKLRLSLLPIYIIMRAIRLVPVHLLVVGFGATWWLHVRDGPLITSVLSVESKACEPKFWYHAFFVNNMYHEDGYCITPTWFLPVDMHMFIVACGLTIVLWRYRSTAFKLYIALAVAFSLLNAVVIRYYNSFEYSTSPESLHGVLRSSPHITDFYMSSWTGLPSCFVGLILAHIQYEIQRRNIILSKYKWFVYIHYVALLILPMWVLAGDIFRQISPDLLASAFSAISKQIFYIIIMVNILGLINIDDPIRRFMSCKSFSVLAQLSLPVMLVHWCVGMTIIARPAAFTSSVFNQLSDWFVLNVITYMIAVPITLLLEVPAQRFLSSLIF